jgi:hypothetical protein
VTTVSASAGRTASPTSLVAGTLLGCGVAFAACELLLAARVGRAPLARIPRVLDYGHVAFATAFMTLSFGALVLVFRIASRRLARALASWLDAWFGRNLALLVARSWLEVGVPTFTVGWFLTTGTRAWTPNFTVYVFFALAFAASIPFVWALGRFARTLDGFAGERRPAILSGAFLLVVAAAAGFIALTESFGHRYGKSHLVTFALLVAFAATVSSEALRATRTRLNARAWNAAWLVGLGVSAVLFVVPPSSAARELFYAERPSRWFGLSLAHVGPDADGDGFARPLGFSAGQDCDDGNARRSPGEPEVVGNGVDDNCFAGDQSRTFTELFSEPSAARERGGFTANVLVILLDSFRFDTTRPSGVSELETPVIAALAAESLVFADYRTCSPRTLESFGDLFYGRLVPTFRGARPASAIARLTAAGVHTVDISSRFRHEHDRVSGWHEEHSIPGSYGEFGDARSVSETVRVLESRPPRPFFVATHLMGAHEPYEPLARCARAAGYERYRCALRLLDERVGVMLSALRRSGLLDETVVVVSADHGEEFGEHGARFHASTVYDEVLHVPWLVRLPRGRGELVREPVGCFDFFPTLLGAANLPSDPLLIGHDYSHGPRPSERAQFARTRPLDARGAFEPRSLAVVMRGTKLLVDLQSGLEQYFDLHADPEEKRPLPRVDSETQRALTQNMDAWLTELARQSLPDERTASAKR